MDFEELAVGEGGLSTALEAVRFNVPLSASPWLIRSSRLIPVDCRETERLAGGVGVVGYSLRGVTRGVVVEVRLDPVPMEDMGRGSRYEAVEEGNVLDDDDEAWD